MGIVGTQLHIFGGERDPSDSIEAWDDQGRMWRQNPGRVESLMIFCAFS